MIITPHFNTVVVGKRVRTWLCGAQTNGTR
jgi:hypothetical protein